MGWLLLLLPAWWMILTERRLLKLENPPKPKQPYHDREDCP